MKIEIPVNLRGKCKLFINGIERELSPDTVSIEVLTYDSGGQSGCGREISNPNNGAGGGAGGGGGGGNAKPSTYNAAPLWQKCRTPFFSRRTVDGRRTDGVGQTWRRKVNGRWEYQQDEETAEDFEARQY